MSVGQLPPLSGALGRLGLVPSEQDAAPLLEADSIESAPVLSLATDPDDDREPTPLLLDADARVPAPAAAEDMLELDLPLTPPPVLDALHDDTPAPAVTAPSPAFSTNSA